MKRGFNFKPALSLNPLIALNCSLKARNCLLLIVFALMGISCQAEKRNGDTMHKLAKMKTPIFWAEGHPGNLDRENWRIEVVGLCKNPKILTWNDLQNMNKSYADARLTSVTRWSVRGNWGGVKLSDIFNSVQADSSVKFVRFWSYGMQYDTSIPVDIALKAKTLLAWEFDDELLTEDYGGPVRLFCPYLWGYKSAKSVVKIELLDKYIPGFWEKRGYTDSGNIEAGFMRDINDKQRIKKIPAGEVIDFIE